MFGDDSPLEAKLLKDYLRSVIRIQGGWQLNLSWNKSFDKLLILYRSIPFSFDKVTIYMAVSEFVKKEDIDDKWKQAFPKLLGNASSLGWSGFIFKKPFFSSSNTKTERLIQGLVKGEALSNMLNSKKDLMDLIKKIKPDSATIDLSINVTSQASLAQFLENPTEISWVASLEKYIIREPGISGLIKNVMSALDLMIATAKEYSLKVYES
ncbi:MAG: hypothetical protein ACP5KW_07150 [Thermoproteota archaeon]|jgi:hypothetical protein